MSEADGSELGCALWYCAPGQAELRTEALVIPGEGECRLRTLFSGISRGTESLVFHGLVPGSEWQRMRCPQQAGDFPFPVKYGYQLVARVETGPAALMGRTVFALHPHQDRVVLPAGALTLLPEGLPPRRAVLAANMETALNALWDGRAAPGDRICIIGGGVIGSLVAYLCGRLPGAEVTLVDINPARAGLAAQFGVAFALPTDAPRDCDLVLHASADPAGLALALDCAGEEATIIELSWYGERSVPVPLGQAFHARRLRLQSSQVGRIPPVRVPRWTHRRRLQKALELLGDGRLDALLEPDIDFKALPEALPHILRAGSGLLAQVVRYQGES